MINARIALLLLCLPMLPACAAFRPTPTPIPRLEIARGESGRCLVVLLPGMYSSPRSFERAEFGEIAKRAGIDADIVAVDGHLGYYRKKTIINRIREDIVVPAREEGRKEVWIVGTSLGGLGAILYKRDHPEDLSGVYAIAPFLGEEEVIDEIVAAGGPDKWVPPDSGEVDVGRELWTWISGGGVDETDVVLHLGWGTEDEFDRSNRLLASILPPEQSYTVEGGHDWTAWTALWSEFVERARPCVVATGEQGRKPLD